MATVFVAGSALAEPIVVLAVGDSLTQGYGLPPKDGFVPQMQAWLEGQGAEVDLINAGVSGDTTAGGAARIVWSLTEKVDAVVLALGGNDMLRGTEPEAVRRNLDTILSEIRARDLPVLLIGIRASGNFGGEYQAAFNAVYPDLAGVHGAALFPDFVQGLTDLGDPGRVLRDYIQSDGLHPNAEGVRLIVDRMGPAVLGLVHRAD